jgi:hypothetical protein
VRVRRRPPTLLIAIVYALLITIVSWATMLSVFSAAAWLAGAATVLTSLSQSGWLPPLQGPWARPVTPDSLLECHPAMARLVEGLAHEALRAAVIDVRAHVGKAVTPTARAAGTDLLMPDLDTFGRWFRGARLAPGFPTSFPTSQTAWVRVRPKCLFAGNSEEAPMRIELMYTALQAAA